MVDEVKFEELNENERLLLLRAFDYDMDKEGYILSPGGNKIRSCENPEEYIKAKDAFLVAGSLKVLDGTPTTISQFLREKLENEHANAKR